MTTATATRRGGTAVDRTDRMTDTFKMLKTRAAATLLPSAAETLLCVSKCEGAD